MGHWPRLLPVGSWWCSTTKIARTRRLVGAANLMTQESLHFMIRHASGLICVSVDGDTAERLDLPLMVPNDKNGGVGTAYRVLRSGRVPGISAEGGLRQSRGSATSARGPMNSRPGHVFPLRAREVACSARGSHRGCVGHQFSLVAACRVLCRNVSDSDGMACLAPRILRSTD